MDKISIIIPVYNVETYIHKCIGSVLAQTYRNIEVILVDDGSPDNSGIICDEYAKKDKRVSVIHKKNGGLSDARNAGIDAATGDYIVFVDSDDYIAPDMIEKLYETQKRNNADITVCGYRWVDKEGKNLKSFHMNSMVCSGREILNEYLVNNINEWLVLVVACNKLFKRSLFDEIRFPYGKLHEDSFVVHELLYTANTVAVIEDECYFYFQNEESIVGKKYTYKRLDDIEAFINRMEFYIDNRLSVYMLMKNFDMYIRKWFEAYNLGDYHEKNFRGRVKELQKMYRKLAKKLIRQDISAKKRLSVLAYRISPYMMWWMHQKKSYRIITKVYNSINKFADKNK